MKLKNIAYRTERRAPMTETSQAKISIESGVEGDFGRKPGKFTVTLLSEASWQAACDQVERDLPWTTRRANLLVAGYEFSETDVGRQLKVGDVVLEVTRETDPCLLMEEACPGLLLALKPDWRGGIRAKVIKAGEVSVDQSIEWLS